MFALYFSKVLFLLIKTPPSKKILTNFKQLELSPNKSQDIRQKTKKLFELKMKRKLRVGGIEMGFCLDGYLLKKWLPGPRIILVYRTKFGCLWLESIGWLYKNKTI